MAKFKYTFVSKAMIDQINDSIFEYFGNRDIQVEPWECRNQDHTYCQLHFIFNAQLNYWDSADRKKMDKAAAYILCEFPEINGVGLGGTYYNREILLRYAYLIKGEGE